jgi:membrane protein YdbS with pleckstrin-like domain
MLHLSHLPNQKPDEQVVMFLRRQWFAWAVIVASSFLMLAVPAAVVWFFWDRVSIWLDHPLIGPGLVVIASIYVLSVWLFSFLEFTDYYLDTWIITTHRVINIEQKGLFNRVASELHLAAVQDVTSDVKGVIRTFFDFGYVLVQTAAEHTQFVFKDIDHPEKVKELIIKLVEEDKKRHAATVVAGVVEGSKAI